MSWEDAKKFCAWLTAKEQREGKISSSQEYRLPTDAEWSWAVGIGGKEGSGSPVDKVGKLLKVFPWGTQWPPPKGAGNYSPDLGADSFTYTSPVGSFAANGLGIYDLSGNVSEWTEDRADSDEQDRVFRGASWRCDRPLFLYSSCRSVPSPDYRSDHLGFRVVLVEGSVR